MPDQKKAFVFDTNFIIQHKELDKSLAKLEDRLDIYICQISIDERIAQQCRNKLEGFDEAKRLLDRHHDIIKINYIYTPEQVESGIRSTVQRIYNEQFKNSIIPSLSNQTTFERIINRSNRKLPPFSDAKDASDKGFKDCILWLSLLEYFKLQGEDEVVFVTDDKAFLNKSDFLEKEFEQVSGKSIIIKSNSFYDELCTPSNHDTSKQHNYSGTTDLYLLRERIAKIIESFRGIDYENDFGDPCWERTFTTYKLFDKDYIKTVFSDLSKLLNDHIFELSLPAKTVLDLDGRIINGRLEIPMKQLEEGQKLYNEITENYPDYLEQFFDTVAGILNKNYEEIEPIIMEEDLPF